MNGEGHYLETLYKELALALGDAVWAFAGIEWLTYECLRRLSKDRLDELVGDLTFRLVWLLLAASSTLETPHLRTRSVRLRP